MISWVRIGVENITYGNFALIPSPFFLVGSQLGIVEGATLGFRTTFAVSLLHVLKRTPKSLAPVRIRLFVDLCLGDGPRKGMANLLDHFDHHRQPHLVIFAPGLIEVGAHNEIAALVDPKNEFAGKMHAVGLRYVLNAHCVE